MEIQKPLGTSKSHFAESLGGLPYPLVADFEREVVTAWGVRRDDVENYKGMPRRSVFVLDRAGVVRWRWVRRHTPKIRRQKTRRTSLVAFG